MKTDTEPVLSEKTGTPLYRASDGSVREGPEPQQARRGEEPLYLAPANYAPMGDRTNGGKGYTASEIQDRFFGYLGYRSPQVDRFLADRANWLMEAPPQPILQARRHSPADVDDCIAQLAPARDAVDACLRDIDARTREADELLASHLIVPPAFRDPALKGLRANQEKLERVLAELKALEEGFRNLPRRPERGER
jgi:hypothetical protein